MYFFHLCVFLVIVGCYKHVFKRKNDYYDDHDNDDDFDIDNISNNKK